MVSYFITVILYWIIRIILLFFYYYSYKIMESKKMWRKKLIMTVEMCQSLYTTILVIRFTLFFLCDEHNYIIFVGSPIFSLTFSKINWNWIADVDYVLTLKEFYILNHKLNVYFRFLFQKNCLESRKYLSVITDLTSVNKRSFKIFKNFM